ncbi:glycosyltransferase [Pseudoalteromonas sp. SCSIO 43101]|uniref:glycosyltransferase n=1 Tax=Pseudoalteromonas sp. SCSIO 43101 TaxID=2822847 RepID=UPI00202B6ABE|nr:glycosyltransferase [Pseudoalteromonas sp. SCSIO 43101]URQ90143.1 glycosyltransferase [Pseudoalteromonas sp. SCSIO 43101]
MRKFAYVTNIPTPYRDFRFRLLSSELKKYNVELVVLYMAKTEPNRDWDANELCKGYCSHFFKNFGVNLGKRFFLHFNPSLLFHLYREKYDFVVVGGISSPTHILAPFFCKQSDLTLSVESNLDSIKNKSLIFSKVKSFIISKYKRFQVTGQRSADYVKSYYPCELTDKNFLFFRNLINEEDFKSVGSPINVDKSKINIVCVARLEEMKGIVEWIRSVKEVDLSNVHIYVVGGGTLYEYILGIIESYKLPITLVGNTSSKQVSAWLQEADIFLLPSKRDASPLSCIEAVYMAKPLLISDKVGNVDDVLKEGENGYKFDIYSQESVVSSLKKALDLTSLERKSFGEKSRVIYVQNFEPKYQISKYVEKILNVN